MIADFTTLQRLTDRKTPTAVRKWLQDKGILYWLNASNQPVTTDQALNDALTKGRKTEPKWNIGRRQ